MFSNDRGQLRKMFFTSWQKHQSGETLEPLEQLVAQIIQQHPEYHALLDDEQKYLDKDYTPEMGETNPFLHMSMHIAIAEQLGTNRPAGIKDLYQQLVTKLGDAHTVEHHIMECLGQMMWEAQHNQAMPDEQQYLECLRKLL
ncbi:MAG: DUF1841 family protein [Thioalkalispiraceae bacterium]|jgi:hypothetical protein